MKRPVIISEPALLDLLDINDYYLVEVDDKTAAKIIDRLEAAVNSLADFTERGSIPKELLTLGIRQYRQVIVKPYRIIYEQLPETTGGSDSYRNYPLRNSKRLIRAIVATAMSGGMMLREAVSLLNVRPDTVMKLSKHLGIR